MLNLPCESPDSPGIYSITCEAEYGSPFGGWVYYGQTKWLAKRFSQHVKDLHGKRHTCKPLQAAWNIYGEKYFIFKIEIAIHDIGNANALRRILNEEEQKYLDRSYGEGCFNRFPFAGTALGVKHTEASRKNMSDSHKGKTLSAEHREKIRSANKGLKRTQEQRARISAGQRGLKRSEEACARNADRQRGKTIPEEVRVKISAALRGRPKSESHRQNAAMAQRGKIIRPESIEKMRASLTGRKLSDETRAKMSAARLGKKWSVESLEKRRNTVAAKIAAQTASSD